LAINLGEGVDPAGNFRWGDSSFDQRTSLSWFGANKDSESSAWCAVTLA